MQRVGQGIIAVSSTTRVRTALGNFGSGAFPGSLTNNVRSRSGCTFRRVARYESGMFGGGASRRRKAFQLKFLGAGPVVLVFGRWTSSREFESDIVQKANLLQHTSNTCFSLALRIFRLQAIIDKRQSVCVWWGGCAEHPQCL